MSKRTQTTIEWRSRSQWEALPESDLQWSELCVVDERGKKAAAAPMIIKALNHCGTFEYREGKTVSISGKKKKTRRLTSATTKSQVSQGKVQKP